MNCIADTQRLRSPPTSGLFPLEYFQGAADGAGISAQLLGFQPTKSGFDVVFGDYDYDKQAYDTFVRFDNVDGKPVHTLTVDQGRVVWEKFWRAG